jgi:hypothetical protein
VTNVQAHPAASRTHRTVRLLHLDGREFASAGFPNGPGEASAPWSWICETVAHELECDEDDVTCLEGDDGTDLVAVEGLPVYKIAIVRNPAS